jgi:hypothetical protein
MIHLNQARTGPWLKNRIMETAPSPPQVETLSRPEVVERIRRILNALTDEERCACAISGRYGIFCGGFGRLSDEELRRRYSWIARKRPNAARAELEQLASYYHLGRQQVTGATVCCDVETREHCGCDGWNSFDNKTLEEFCRKLTGRPVHIA